MALPYRELREGLYANNSIVLTVTDTAGGTSDKTLVVNVANINDAPSR